MQEIKNGIDRTHLNIATLLLCSGCIILNKTKTPDFTFLGVKLGVCFAIC
jgi:hypothetical protein